MAGQALFKSRARSASGSQGLSNAAAIFARCAASGIAPEPAAMFSSRCAGLRVPGITQVTAGCETIHFNANSAHDVAPISAASAENGARFTYPIIQSSFLLAPAPSKNVVLKHFGSTAAALT